jgi:hypothetical protein
MATIKLSEAPAGSTVRLPCGCTGTVGAHIVRAHPDCRYLTAVRLCPKCAAVTTLNGIECRALKAAEPTLVGNTMRVEFDEFSALLKDRFHG